MIKDQITLRIINKANAPVPIKIFASPDSEYAQRDRSILVEWDLSSEPFTGTKLQFQYGSNIFNPSGNPNSVSDVVNILNTLNIAIFYSNNTTVYATDLTDLSIRSGIITIS